MKMPLQQLVRTWLPMISAVTVSMYFREISLMTSLFRTGPDMRNMIL